MLEHIHKFWDLGCGYTGGGDVLSLSIHLVLKGQYTTIKMNIFPIILNKKASDKIKYRFHKVQKTDKINHNVSRDKIIKKRRGINKITFPARLEFLF